MSPVNCSLFSITSTVVTFPVLNTPQIKWCHIKVWGRQNKVKVKCNLSRWALRRSQPRNRRKRHCQCRLTLTFVCVNLLYPGEGVDFHQRVRNADHVHPIHDTLRRTQTRSVMSALKHVEFMWCHRKRAVSQDRMLSLSVKGISKSMSVLLLRPLRNLNFQQHLVEKAHTQLLQQVWKLLRKLKLNLWTGFKLFGGRLH